MLRPQSHRVALKIALPIDGSPTPTQRFHEQGEVLDSRLLDVVKQKNRTSSRKNPVGGSGDPTIGLSASPPVLRVHVPVDAVILELAKDLSDHPVAGSKGRPEKLSTPAYALEMGFRIEYLPPDLRFRQTPKITMAEGVAPDQVTFVHNASRHPRAPLGCDS